MSYFNEIADYATYSGHEADFHFTYNANSGGGQAFLGGRFYDENGQLTSPETLNGKFAIFRYVFRSEAGEELSVIINDDKAKYEIKPRGNGSTSMKLGIGTDRIAPSKVISAFMMLPPTCGVKTPSNLQLSILSANNYWLQSMWLECSMNAGAENEAIFTVKDCVFGGGVSKETTALSCRRPDATLCAPACACSSNGASPSRRKSLVRSGNMADAAIFSTRREEILFEISQKEGYLREIEPMVKEAQTVYEAYDKKLRELKKQSRMTVEEMKLRGNMKDLLGDLDELRRDSATDKLLGSVRDGAEDLRKEVDGAIVVHASRTTTKMSMAEKNAAKAQSDAYLQSLATKYNGKPAIQAPRSGVTFDAPKSKVKEERK